VGCSFGGTRPAATASAPPTCARADLSVTWTAEGSVRAQNTSGHTCTLAGTHAVWVPWWQVAAPGPVPATGTLLPGAALVQAYAFGPSNTCPGGAFASPGVEPFPIQVEGYSYSVLLPSAQAYTITQCDGVTALPPRIVAPA